MVYIKNILTRQENFATMEKESSRAGMARPTSARFLPSNDSTISERKEEKA